MADSTQTRSTWSGKWMFILAAAASAVGLGNMWRFPYLAAKYGGGMFLLTYVVLVFTFGVSMLILEISLGIPDILDFPATNAASFDIYSPDGATSLGVLRV